MGIAISIKSVTKTFKTQTVLKTVSLECNSGEIRGIVGYNGSGKTVLFKTICGFFSPDTGDIWVNNKRRNGRILTEAGIVIDGPAFLDSFSGIDNLEFLWLLKHKRNRKHLEDTMAKVGLNPFEKKKVGKYSMGMKQRLAIAQAIMENQSILLLDEPMNGLDKEGVGDMRELFLSMKEEGKTILLASHNKEDIDLLCDHVYEMDAGVLTLVK